jgi:hypothetical protein
MLSQSNSIKADARSPLKAHLMALNPFCLVAILAVLNAVLPALLLSLRQHSFSEALFSGFGQSFIIWFSLFVCFKLYLNPFDPVTAYKKCPTWQYSLALVLSMSLILPFSLSSWVCAGIASIAWQATLSPTQRKSNLGYSSILLFALAIREPSAQFFLQIVAEQVLALDAQLAFLLLDVFSDQVSLQNNIIVNKEGTNLVILTGCSAFGNLSLAMLLYLSLKLFWFAQLDKRDVYNMLLLIVLVLLSNSSRLALMTMSNDSYAFIHDGLGADLFDLIILIIPLFILIIPSYIRGKQ